MQETNEMPRKPAETSTSQKGLAGAQTLIRGLDVISAVAAGHTTLPELMEKLQLTRSTTHRLAATLVEERYLSQQYREGYSLGPKLLELGYLARQQMSLSRVAREHIEKLANDTGDTVHLGVIEVTRALYLEKIPGRRRVEISSRVGERQPLRSTGLGKALLLGADEDRWRELYEYEDKEGQRYNVDLGEWLKRMHDYKQKDVAFDLEENEDLIRCVAAPIRDVSGQVIAAISLSSAAQYMDDDRMERLVDPVSEAARAISINLGWTGS
jgi:DNA-binding IclR family transcriptional regulator